MSVETQESVPPKTNSASLNRQKVILTLGNTVRILISETSGVECRKSEIVWKESQKTQKEGNRVSNEMTYFSFIFMNHKLK